MKEVVNIADLPLGTETHGARFAMSRGKVGEALGLTVLGCTLYLVPPGKTAFPFHRHHGSDEMFYIVSGEGEYRIGDKRLPVRAGDCLGAPAGGEAHQIVNTGKDEIRYLGLSNNPPADLVEYPDSGKIGARVGAKGLLAESATFKQLGRLAPADYWDGEDG